MVWWNTSRKSQVVDQSSEVDVKMWLDKRLKGINSAEQWYTSKLENWSRFDGSSLPLATPLLLFLLAFDNVAVVVTVVEA